MHVHGMLVNNGMLVIAMVIIGMLVHGMLVVDMLVIAILFYMIDEGLTRQMSYIKDLGSREEGVG
jgi:hypothetical protein